VECAKRLNKKKKNTAYMAAEINYRRVMDTIKVATITV